MLKKLSTGLALTFSIAFIALSLYGTELNKQLHISSLLYAIIIGMIFSNFTNINKMEIFQPGVKFTSKKILRFGVILQGFKLSLTELTKLGFTGIIFIACLLTATILTIKFVSDKFGLDEELGICLAAGTSICGASAIATIGPIVDADEKDTAFGIGAITFFGTIAMFVFPMIYKALNLDPQFYGAWVGVTLPDVAEVVAASGAVGSPIAESMAILTKLTRVLFLVPVSIAFTIWKSRKNGNQEGKKIDFPIYVLGFILAVIINSLQIIPPEINKFIPKFANIVLTIAMASLGLKINLKKLFKVGIKPFIVGFIGMVFIQTFGCLGAYILFN
ncbi:YeiH family protein [uncultured Cetobacterium sp.]|uniref:YeiH family protein n=1 Tax=uncultured Cetobacterium sp. TaxID=527638 RepID=UPI002635C75E|nr:YeiH family protein [uncultured Cetobacterium sp.]